MIYIDILLEKSTFSSTDYHKTQTQIRVKKRKMEYMSHNCYIQSKHDIQA